MHGSRTMITALCCLSLLWLGGCARRSAPAPSPDGRTVLEPAQPPVPLRITPQLPGWVEKGSGAYQDGSERFFYGVGSATTASGNRILTRTAADNLARVELGKVLRRFMNALAGDQMNVEAGALEQVVQDGLANAVVTDHWSDPRDGRMYALCSIDLKKFKESVAFSRGLDMSLRSTLLDKADQQHAQMVRMP